jgi:hypothetical protein
VEEIQMCMFMVRSSATPERLSEVETAIERAFAAIVEGTASRPFSDGEPMRSGVTDQESRSVGPRAAASMNLEPTNRVHGTHDLRRWR